MEGMEILLAQAEAALKNAEQAIRSLREAVSVAQNLEGKIYGIRVQYNILRDSADKVKTDVLRVALRLNRIKFDLEGPSGEKSLLIEATKVRKSLLATSVDFSEQKFQVRYEGGGSDVVKFEEFIDWEGGSVFCSALNAALQIFENSTVPEFLKAVSEHSGKRKSECAEFLRQLEALVEKLKKT